MEKAQFFSYDQFKNNFFKIFLRVNAAYGKRLFPVYISLSALEGSISDILRRIFLHLTESASKGA